MPSSSVSGLPNLKGKVHPDVEDAIVRIYQQNQDVQNLMNNFKATLANYPTVADLNAHAARVQQAVSTLPSFDALAAGSSTAHFQQASILPAVSGAFAYTSTTSAITWFWDGSNGSSLLSIFLPNGVVLPVPPAFLQTTGLASNTTYNFFPYFDVSLFAVVFAQDPTNGTGTPPDAFTGGANKNPAKALASADGHLSLSDTPMQGATTASGSGSGSGGGRGGFCVSRETQVLPLEGDFYSCYVPEREWIELETLGGRRLRASPGHLIFTECGVMRMKNLQIGMRVVTHEGLSPVRRAEHLEEEGEKRLVWVPQGNLYWANGILSHNIK